MRNSNFDWQMFFVKIILGFFGCIIFGVILYFILEFLFILFIGIGLTVLLLTFKL